MEICANENVQNSTKARIFMFFRTLNIQNSLIDLHAIDKNQPFTMGDITFTPIEALHYKLPMLGFKLMILCI